MKIRKVVLTDELLGDISRDLLKIHPRLHHTLLGFELIGVRNKYLLSRSQMLKIFRISRPLPTDIEGYRRVEDGRDNGRIQERVRQYLTELRLCEEKRNLEGK